LLESLQTVASLAPVALSLAPYLAAFRAQHKDEAFLQSLSRHFPIPKDVGLRSQRKAWVTDTFADVVVIRVQDWGCGIERKHLPRLFERFYRVDKARSRELGGTVLGLAIVRHIAPVHRGSVSVQSEVGAGSTFSISLPMVSPES
jgi:signal transduction histidine kinase